MMTETFAIRQAEFTVSAGAGTVAYPSALPCEIAFVGKSNVGKSSLINALCHNGKLARTSQQPGKTRLINFFTINRGELFLVDLPGYGYARASKDEQKSWGRMIETYLGSGRVTHLILLVDIRHEPTELDRQMYRYVMYYNIPHTVVATKADKLPRAQRKQAACKAAKALGAPAFGIPCSSESGEGVDAVLARIGEIVSDANALFQAKMEKED